MHNLHNDYPLAGEKIKVTKEMLSEYQLQIIEDNNSSHGENKTLILNLDNKRKYKLHNKNLKLKTWKFRTTVKKNSKNISIQTKPF